MDIEKFLDVINNYGKNDWGVESMKNKIFFEYIKSFMKELNEECRQAGWKYKNNLVKYETLRNNGKVFCFIDSSARVVLELGKFDLLKYVELFEANKSFIRSEALKFVAEFPEMAKKFDPLIEEYIEFMKERPAYIEKDKLKILKYIKGYDVIVSINYIGAVNNINFNIYKELKDYPLQKICRAQSRGLATEVAYAIFKVLQSNRRHTIITQKEQDFAVNHFIKQQNIYTATQLLSTGKLAPYNVDKLNGLLMVDKINNPTSSYFNEDDDNDWGSPF